jgi:hypothetical protein
MVAGGTDVIMRFFVKAIERRILFPSSSDPAVVMSKVSASSLPARPPRGSTVSAFRLLDNNRIALGRRHYLVFPLSPSCDDGFELAELIKLWSLP